MTNPLLRPLTLHDIAPTEYFFVNLLFFLLCLALFSLRVKRTPNNLTPALFVSGLLLIFFGLPATLFSSALQNGLDNHYFFSLSIFGSILACLAWSSLVSADVLNQPATDLISARSKALVMACMILCLIIYFSKLKFYCTGLFALLFDPELALLARELSTKLRPSTAGNLAYGILSNSICPLLFLLSINSILRHLQSRKILPLLFWLFLSLLTILCTLLPGAKGGVIPIITVTGAYIVFSQGLLQRIILMGICLCLIAIILSVELVRERSSTIIFPYKFGQCVSYLEACKSGEQLLSSLKLRSYSLGASDARIQGLEKNLGEHCTLGASQTRLPNNSSSAQEVKLDATKTNSNVRSPNFNLTASSLFEKAKAYSSGILYRAFVVPLQVASWHFLFKEEHGKPSLNVLPLMKFTPSYKNMPNKIHSLYASKYADGANVSTGTSPTSFILAYPAYWGWLGFLGALGLLFAFDLLAILLRSSLSRNLVDISTSLYSLISLNFILSDFFTTIISLGGAFTLLLLAILTKLERHSKGPRRS